MASHQAVFNPRDFQHETTQRFRSIFGDDYIEKIKTEKTQPVPVYSGVPLYEAQRPQRPQRPQLFNPQYYYEDYYYEGYCYRQIYLSN